VAGGWDTLLCLDPRDPEAFTDARAERTGIELAWSRLAPGLPRTLVHPAGSEIVLGPMAAAFARHCGTACVVNGIAVESADHESSARAFMTTAAPVLAAHRERTSVPYLASRADMIDEGALRVESVDELAAREARLRLDAESAERYRVRHPSAGEAQAALAVAALRHDVAQCVRIQLATGLDTHDERWATVQPRRQVEAFEALATLVDDLGREGWLDDTTIVVFSEFGRAARLNAQGGRDHGAHASALLVGAGVPHGRVIGRTGYGLRPLPIDPRSGRAVRTGGVPLTPARLWASVLASAGVRRSALGADPLPCLMA
jgi:hypothetical protein